MLTQKYDAKLEGTINKIQLIRNNRGTRGKILEILSLVRIELRDNFLQILSDGVIYS